MIKDIRDGELNPAEIAWQDYERTHVSTEREIEMRRLEAELRNAGTPENKISQIVNPQQLLRRHGIIDISG